MNWTVDSYIGRMKAGNWVPGHQEKCVETPIECGGRITELLEDDGSYDDPEEVRRLIEDRRRWIDACKSTFGG